MSQQNSEHPYPKLMQKALSLLERKGFKNLKADLEGYEEPTKFTNPDTQESYQPDITAKSTIGKHYFEIVNQKYEDEVGIAGKWKLFAKLAKIKNGKFHLLVPRGKMRYTNELINQHNIEAITLKLQG